MPRVRATTASRSPHAAHRSSENQYGRIMAHALGSIRRRAGLAGVSEGWGGVLLTSPRIRLKHLETRSIVRVHVTILQVTEERMGTQASRARTSLVVACLLAPLRRGAPLVGLALVVVGCASASLMPPGQAQAIKDRERALAVHADAIQTAISQSGQVGALAFLDTGDGHLVVLPGSSPADAWARFATSPEGGTGRGSVPLVLTFVHRADMPKAPEAVTLSDLQHQQALRASVAALDTERQSIEERLSMVERGLAEAVATAKRESDASLAARTELQKDLAAARTLLRQTAQLATLNQEANAENASGIRKMATASQELAASSARLEETVRKLSETLAKQFEELAKRLDSIQGKAGTGQ